MALKLKATTREQKGKGLNKLRGSGFVPGIVYGRGVANVSVMVGMSALKSVLKEAGENVLVELEVEGDKSRHVIINDTQSDVLKGTTLHVDFLEVKLDQQIKADVPLNFVGESPAVKELEGILIKNLQYLEIEAVPQELPHDIEVDISSLKTFEDHITVASLKINPKIKILSDMDLVIASVVPPRSESELESLKEEVVENVSQVEGVVKEEAPAESEAESSKSEE